MKRYYSILTYVILTVFLASCGGSSKKIEEVTLIPVKNGKEFQYIDREGKIVINPQFAHASVFRDGLALVQTSGEKPKWGFIDEDGKYVIAATYEKATVFSEDLAWVVSEDAAPAAINKKGELKFMLQNAEKVRNFSEGLAAFSQITDEGEKWGFVDKEGKVKINPQFSSVGSFQEGKCAVSNKDKKWGYIDDEGKLVINHQFDEAKSFIKERAVVKLGEKVGVIDADGKYIINPQFTDIVNDGDLFLVEQDKKFGWTDKEGKILINPQFTEALPFMHNDLAAVKSGETYGFIDKEGKIKINPQFDMALPFNKDLALVVSAKKIGFIDKEGKYVINPQFDEVSSDLVDYLILGETAYKSVYTDFFNISAISSRIKVDAPEGLTFETPISEVSKKFKKVEADFNKYASENMMISTEKITNNVYLSFYILGNPWKTVGYTHKFDENFTPTGFMYIIDLYGKAKDKQDDVTNAFEKSLSGYTKDSTASKQHEVVYKNDKQLVKILKDKSLKDASTIIIAITPHKKEVSIK